MKNIEKVRLVLTALFGISIAVSISFTYIFGIILLVDWGFRVLLSKKERFWISSPMDAPIFLYILWGVLIVFITGSTSFRKSLTSQSAYLLFILVVHGQSIDNFKVMVRWFLIAAAAIGLLGIIQILTGISYLPNEKVYRVPEFFQSWPEGLQHFFATRNSRAVGTRSHPLTYSETMLLPFFIFFSFLFYRIQKRGSNFKKDRLFWMGLIFTFSGLVFSLSRAVWLGIFAGLVFASFSVPRRMQRWVLIMILVGGGLVAALSPQARGRLMSIFSSRAGTPGDQQSKNTRLSLWKQGLKTVHNHPLTGHGLRGVKIIVEDPVTKSDRVWTEVHNIYLQCLLERGYVGFGLFLWVLFMAFRVIPGFGFRQPQPWRGLCGQ